MCSVVENCIVFLNNQDLKRLILNTKFSKTNVNKNRTPPLKSLRAFESAARNLSISKAADELYVTPGAISQQIKILEEHLEVQLFNRLHRRILLTDAGQMLLPGIQQGLGSIHVALRDLESVTRKRPVTITTPPSFAIKWLVPRLKLFRTQFPNIDVRIDTSIEVVDLAYSDIDIAIRFGSGDYPGMDTSLLMHQEVFPVCSPNLIRKEYPLNHPSDLRHYDILKFDEDIWDSDWPDWQMWLMVAGAEDIDTSRGISYNQQELLVEAAVEGQGIALVGSVSAAADLASGKLIKPFEQTYPLDLAYYLVTTPGKANYPGIPEFRNWIMDQVSSSE